MMSLPEILNRRLHQRDIDRLVQNANVEQVYSLIFSRQERVAYNALWVITHLKATWNPFLFERRNALIDMLLCEKHIGKKRLLFNLLNRLPLESTDVRTDYLDFCLRKINSPEPYAIRAFALKQAYAQARLFPELLGELRAEIDLLASSTLSPGLRSALRQIKDF